jgi:Novel STAND NTPase 1
VTATAADTPTAARPAAPETPASPYRGLRPYTEAEAAFFFGRETEGEIVSANLLGARLTLLYGPSGVGKSSILLAGVVSRLRERSRENLADDDAAGFAVVVVRSWADPDPLTTIAAAARAEVAALLERNDLPDPPSGATLADVLAHWSVHVQGKLLVLFDQFEEYFLYHDHDHETGATFDAEFPQAVNRPELRANFLLAIRDDSLAKLDSFKGRIPNLFENRLRIDHLTIPAARDAVKLPIQEYNRRVEPDQRVEIEEELVKDVLDQVRTGRVSLESAGAGILRNGSEAEARVETPILQLVLTALWEKEAEQGSRTLRAQTFVELGGAEQIVRDRLDERMNRLDDGEQEIALNVARFLVTPSGTKIAWTATDLSALAYPEPDHAEWAYPQVESILKKLSEGDARILRPVAPPGGQGPMRYEIFHDILGPALLDWRARKIKDRELADAVSYIVRNVVLIGTTFWWLLLTLGFVVVGAGENHKAFFGLTWTLSALVVWMGWWRVLRRRRGRPRRLRLLVEIVLAELAAFTAPISLLVIVPVVAFRRWRRRRAVHRSAPQATPAGQS